MWLLEIFSSLKWFYFNVSSLYLCPAKLGNKQYIHCYISHRGCCALFRKSTYLCRFQVPIRRSTARTCPFRQDWPNIQCWKKGGLDVLDFNMFDPLFSGTSLLPLAHAWPNRASMCMGKSRGIAVG